MKAYALDLRERVVKFIQGGGSKAEAARRFALARSSVYRYLTAAQKGALTPKTSWGTWRKLDPQKLQAHVKKHPDATLKELQTVFGVSHHAVWVRLGQLGFTLKKTHKISRAQRGSAVAVPARAGKTQRPDRLLSRRMRRGSPPAS
jgi:transposase